VQDPAGSGVLLAAVEDPIAVQAQQLPGAECEARGDPGRLLGDPGPRGEMFTVVRPGSDVLGQALVWMAAHPQAPSTRSRGHGAAAASVLAGTACPNLVRPAVFHLHIPRESVQRPPTGITRNGAEQALAIDQEGLAARGGRALAEDKDQIWVVIPELRVTVDMQLGFNTCVTRAVLGWRAAAGGGTRDSAAGHGRR
jgi:hypothetical protein